MFGAIGFALNVAGIVVPLAFMTKPLDQPSLASTNVQIIVGHGDSTAGGGCPDIALWDNNGERIGQYKPGSKCKVKEGEVSQVFNIPHKQTVPSMSQADPYYIMLSTMSNDAICISAISIMGQKIQGNFFGDTGYMCGMSWFPSDNAIGSDFTKPRCVWLDADHSHNINARAVSFHLNDMQPDSDKMAQYQQNRDTLCKSSPRFSFWGNLLPDGIPPFFKPPLKYTGDNGTDTDLTKVLDDPKHPIDKGKYMRRRRSPKTRRWEQKGSNHDITRLIISDQDDDVRQVCEHPNSYGWDIVSKKQGLFCCMEHKQLYPLCSVTIEDKCFDLDTKTLRGSSDVHITEADHLRFGRSYNTTSYWKTYNFTIVRDAREKAAAWTEYMSWGPLATDYPNYDIGIQTK